MISREFGEDAQFPPRPRAAGIAQEHPSVLDRYGASTGTSQPSAICSATSGHAERQAVGDAEEDHEAFEVIAISPSDYAAIQHFPYELCVFPTQSR
jgi:hypothetical protein